METTNPTPVFRPHVTACGRRRSPVCAVARFAHLVYGRVQGEISSQGGQQHSEELDLLAQTLRSRYPALLGLAQSAQEVVKAGVAR